MAWIDISDPSNWEERQIYSVVLPTDEGYDSLFTQWAGGSWPTVAGSPAPAPGLYKFSVYVYVGPDPDIFNIRVTYRMTEDFTSKCDDVKHDGDVFTEEFNGLSNSIGEYFVTLPFDLQFWVDGYPEEDGIACPYPAAGAVLYGYDQFPMIGVWPAEIMKFEMEVDGPEPVDCFWTDFLNATEICGI